MRLIVSLTFLVAVPASGQTSVEPHRLPFASEGNTVELAVANTSASIPLEGVTVRVESAPEWLLFAGETTRLELVAPGEEATAALVFDVDRNAAVGEVAEVVIRVEKGRSLLSSTTIRVEVEAPRAFALSPNYPNPFNPATTLAFELPQTSDVTLTVFDVLGREIVRLAEGEYAPGRHDVVFDARHVASGLYIARLIAETEGGAVATKIRRMTLLR